MEAYSQTAWRPVKPLVRAHLRKAVNKPHDVAFLVNVVMSYSSLSLKITKASTIAPLVKPESSRRTGISLGV